MSGNGDELDPREGGLDSGLEGGIQDLQTRRDAAQQAGDDISPSDIDVSRTDEGVIQADLTDDAVQREREQQRQAALEDAAKELDEYSKSDLEIVEQDGERVIQPTDQARAQLEQEQRQELRQEAVQNVDGIDDPSLINIVQEGDQFRAELSDEAQEQRLRATTDVNERADEITDRLENERVSSVVDSQELQILQASTNFGELGDFLAERRQSLSEADTETKILGGERFQAAPVEADRFFQSPAQPFQETDVLLSPPGTDEADPVPRARPDPSVSQTDGGSGDETLSNEIPGGLGALTDADFDAGGQIREEAGTIVPDEIDQQLTSQAIEEINAVETPEQVDVTRSGAEFGVGLTDQGERAVARQRAERQLEDRFGAEFDQGDIMVSESDGSFSARLTGRAAVEQANEALIERQRAVAAQFDEQLDADVTADDVTSRQTEDGIAVGLDEEFRREQARQQVAQQIQQANPDADSIVARRAFSGLEAGEGFQVEVADDGSVTTQLTPEGREIVSRTIARTENPDAESEFVQESFEGDLEFDEEGRITNVESEEQFGDAPLGDDFLRAGGEFVSENIIDPVAGATGDVSGAPLQAAEFLPGDTAAENALVSIGEQQERLTEQFVESGLETFNVPNTTAGLIEAGEFIGAGLERSAVGDAVEATPLVEGPADQGEDLDEFLGRAEDRAAEIGATAVESAQSDPLGAGATLGGSLTASLAGIGAASRISGTAGRGAAIAIQPGEEAASAVASRAIGSTARGSRILSTLPNNRIDPENIALRGGERAAAAARARIPDGDLLNSLRAAGPDRSFVSDTRAQQTITTTREAEAEAEAEAETGDSISEEDILRQQEQLARENLPPRETFESAEAYTEAFERRVRRLRGEDPFEGDARPETETETSQQTQEQAATTTPAPEGRAAEANLNADETPPTAETDIERAVEAPFVEQEAAGQVDTVTGVESVSAEEQPLDIGFDAPTAERVDTGTEELVGERTALDDELRMDQPTTLEEELQTEQRLQEETELETELRTELETEQRTQLERQLETEFESEAESETETFDEPDSDNEDGFFGAGDPFGEEQFNFDVADPDELVGGGDSQ